MTERDRIQALLAEGKITPAEAELLLDALGEIESAEARLDTLNDQPSAAAAAASAATGNGPERWVRVEVSAGDLTIAVDNSLSEPLVHGEVELQRDGENFVVRGRSGEGSLSDWLGGILRRRDVTIKLPAGFGVSVAGTAGDVTIDGVPFVRGRLTAGDVSLKNVGGVDLVAISGDIDARLRLTQGEHTLKATSGDVDIRLLAGSSVRVEGRATSGDISLPKGFTSQGELVVRKFGGTVGSGRATLKLNIISGDLDLEVEHE
jgi:hypothetical protein